MIPVAEKKAEVIWITRTLHGVLLNSKIRGGGGGE